MSRSALPHRPPVGTQPLHAVQVLGGAGSPFGGGAPAARTVAHVRSLAQGLVARGVRVTVCAGGDGQDGELRGTFTEAGADFVSTSARTEPEAVASLRALCADADLVHAHGLRAGLLAALALRRRREVPLVVTWHAPPATEPDGGRADGARELLLRVLVRRVVRAAWVVLGATSDLVERARRSGARDARLAPVALPGPPVSDRPSPAEGPWVAPFLPALPVLPAPPGPPGQGTAAEAGEGPEETGRHKLRADIGAVDRPLIVAVGRLDARHGFDTALTASRAWLRLDPPPLLAVAGEGPERARLQRRIDEEALPVRLLGRRDDALRLLAGADLALLSARWEGRSLPAQEALRAGVPLVATEVGGIPELVGDAAVLVPYGDADSLAHAVAALLSDPARRARLAAAGRARAAELPTEDDTVAQVLSVYDELTGVA